MPYPFTLSTTSHLVFQSHLTSSTHPSLPWTTTSQRNILRSTLKSHKRLSPQDQGTNLNNILACLVEYFKYLNTIDFALSGKLVAGEDVEIALAKEVEVEWRPTLSSSPVPGRDPERIKGRGLDYEIRFVHQTYAEVQNLLARQSLLGLYATTNPTAEQRVSLIQTALKHLRTAYSVHTYLTRHSSEAGLCFPPQATDISSSVQSALQRLTSAEINLLCVLKDDPYPSLLIQSRNHDDKEWMFKAPTIPKVRAQVLTRLCLGASEHAAAASAAIKVEGKKLSKDFIDYVDDVRKTARARACRFQALDSDLGGQTGLALAWLHAASNELGIEMTKDGSKVSSLGKLKASWNDRKEDKKIGKGGARWGTDGGKSEEGRILEYLEKKFSKANNTVNIQIVPEWRPLLATLPSGMNMPVDEKWDLAVLSEEELTPMRAPPEAEDYAGESSGEEDEQFAHDRPGTFPGTQQDYSRSKESYY